MIELRSQANECGRQESNLRRPAFQAGALPTELQPRAIGRRGWTRTSSFLFVRQALSAIELLAQDHLSLRSGREAAGFRGLRGGRSPLGDRPPAGKNVIPGQGVEPRPPRSERGVLPVRRSRIVRLRPAAPGSTQTHSIGFQRSPALVPSLLCPCHSPTLRPWITGRGRARPRDDVIVEGLWSRSLVRRMKRRTQKQTQMRARYFSADRRGVFLSQAGPRFDLELVQAEHHLSRYGCESPPKRRRRPVLGRPRLARYTARGLARTPPSEG